MWFYAGMALREVRHFVVRVTKRSLVWSIKKGYSCHLGATRAVKLFGVPKAGDRITIRSTTGYSGVYKVEELSHGVSMVCINRYWYTVNRDGTVGRKNRGLTWEK